MTRQTLRSILGTSLLVVFLALATVSLAADYPGAYFDLRSGSDAAVVQAPGWTELMGVLEACAAGSDCAVTVACDGQTFLWTADGPLLAVTGPDALADETDEPKQATGGSFVPDVVPGVPAHKLMP